MYQWSRLSFPAAPAPLFDAGELEAVRVGMLDPLETLRNGRITTVMRTLAGRRTTRLANPRLEALRRLTVQLRHGADCEIVREARRAANAGVTTRQVDALLAQIDRRIRLAQTPAPQRSA